VNWLIIGLAIVALFVVSRLIHFRNIRHKISAIFLVLLLLFAYLSVFSVIRANGIDIKSPSGVFQVVKVYFSWLGYMFDNVKVLTGNVVRMDWAPGNLTA